MSLLLANYTNIDIIIQNHFFNFETKKWLIDRNEPIKKFIFYNFPKILFGLLILVILIFAVLGFRKKSPFFFTNRHKFLLIFLGLSLIPLIAGNVKKFTNIYCPSELAIYDGNYPYVKVLEHYDENFQQIKKGKCFPAGHAVTGFALLILFFAFEKKNHKILALFLAIISGWILGLYQMMKGAHFFSDTLTAMLLCFLLAALIYRTWRNTKSHPCIAYKTSSFW